MQPTDPSFVVGFRVLKTRLPGRRSSREPCLKHQGLVVVHPHRRKDLIMKHRILSLAITLTAIAATVLAGGASVRGF